MMKQYARCLSRWAAVVPALVPLALAPVSQAWAGAYRSPQASQDSRSAEASPSDTAKLEADALYQLGLELITQKQWEKARAILERVVADYPNTEAAGRARQRLEDLEAVLSEPGGPSNSAAAKVAQSGRAELAVFQTIVGGFVGGAIPGIAESSTRGVLAGSMLGTGLGLGIALAVTADSPITPAQAAMVNYGQLFGAANMLLWDLGLRAGDLTDKEPLLMTVGGIGLGTAAGALLAKRYSEVPASHVSVAVSSGLWATYATETLMILLGGDDISGQAYLLMAPLSADLGLLAGIVGMRRVDFPISRSRVQLINLGGTVGAFLSMGSALLLGIEGKAVGATMLVGAAGGLLVAWKATEDWDKQYHPEVFARNPSTSLLTLEDGRVKLGQPLPTVAFSPVRGAGGESTEKGGLRPHVQVSLFGGRF